MRITVLGRTGSVGMSTLDLVGRTAETYEIVALTAHSNTARLAEIAVRHNARLAVIGDEARYAELKNLPGGNRNRGRGRCRRGRGSGLGARRLHHGVDRRRRWLEARRSPPPAKAAASRFANKECLVSAGNVFSRGDQGRRDRADPRRQRAFGGIPGHRLDTAQSHRAHHAHGVRRPVPHLGQGASRQGHRGRGR